MSRYMLAPGVWSENVPGIGIAHGSSAFASRPALTVGSMMPLVRSVAILSDADRQRIRERERIRKAANKAARKRAFSIHQENRHED